MNKLDRSDVANIKRLDAVAEKPRRRKRILDKKILDLQTELLVVEGEIKFWEKQIEQISGESYAKTMAFVKGEDFDVEPQTEEQQQETEQDNNEQNNNN